MDVEVTKDAEVQFLTLPASPIGGTCRLGVNWYVSEELRGDVSLPPLDDLDEGLQCCGQHFDTHASFMIHRREHVEA